MFKHLSLNSSSAHTRPQHRNLPVHLRTNPFFVFCSFERPFILSPSFMSSASCCSLSAHYIYQTIPRWEASRGRRGGRGKKRKGGTDELEREMKEERFPVPRKMSSCPFPLVRCLFLCILMTDTYPLLPNSEVFQSINCFNMFPPVLSDTDSSHFIHSFCIIIIICTPLWEPYI